MSTTFVILPWKLTWDPGFSNSQLQHFINRSISEGKCESLAWESEGKGRESGLMAHYATSNRLQLEFIKQVLVCLLQVPILLICGALVSL